MLIMQLSALTLLLLWGAVAASPAGDCGSIIGNFSEVEVTGCNNSHECVLKKGTNVTLYIIFTTKAAVTSVTAVVHGIVQGVPVPFPLSEPDACKTALHCPLSAGPTYNYTAQLPVKKFYPSMQVTVKWELRNEAGDDIVCVEIPARIR